MANKHTDNTAAGREALRKSPAFKAAFRAYDAAPIIGDGSDELALLIAIEAYESARQEDAGVDYDTEPAEDYAYQTYDGHDEQFAFVAGAKWQATRTVQPAAQPSEAVDLKAVREALERAEKMCLEDAPRTLLCVQEALALLTQAQEGK